MRENRERDDTDDAFRFRSARREETHRVRPGGARGAPAGRAHPVAVPGSVRVDRGRGPVSRLPSLIIVHLGLG